MTWLLLALGLGLVVWGLWGPHAPVPPRAGEGEEVQGDDKERRQSAWRVLTKPVNTERGLAERRRTQLIRTVSAGAGACLLIASVLVGNFEAGDRGDAAPPTTANPPATTGPVAQHPPTTEPEPPPAPKPAGDEVLLTIESGQVASEIAESLLNLGVIADEAAFLNRLEERELESALQIGEFPLRTGMTLDEVIDALTS